MKKEIIKEQLQPLTRFLYVTSKSFLLLFFAVIFSSISRPVAADDDAAIWAALRSEGHIVLLRHSLAPGTGDPSEFELGNCRTQRNLSDEGRRQARGIGALFRNNGIRTAKVFSSQWCRCQETARLLELGTVQELPVLNSFFQEFHKADAQTDQLKTWLAEQELKTPLVLVTHQVNISALVGVYPRSGELVVLHRDGSGRLTLVGTVKTD